MIATEVLPAARAAEATVRGRAVHLEGGLFGPDLLERLQAGTLPGQRPADFGIEGGRSVLDEVAEVYRRARDLWRVFRRRLERLPEDDPGTSLTREGWVIPFLGLLGYELRYNPKAFEAGGVSYAVSHRAGENEDAPPVHIVGARRELGRVDPSGRPRVSPHALVQEFLNRSGRVWGLVTNGRVLRLLRESSLLRRQAYVEFDLEAIFEAEGDAHFTDFVLLYRLLHRTRLPRGVVDAQESWLERYHQEALEQGSRARERLRDGVEECLKILGTGFLRANGPLPYGDEPARRLYADLLRLVYRFLFLLVAEERGLLGCTDLYREHYSLTRLRRLVDRREAYTDHDDLWQSLRVLWHLLRDPTPVPQADGKPLASLLGLPVLDGGLFEPIELEQLTVPNRDLLEAFYNLLYYYDEEARAYQRVNYAALDVEELGSVYESLLDNHPEIVQEATGPAFRFSEGMERKSTGSYYTAPELVQELVKSALEPVLTEKLRGARDPESCRRAILTLRVLDPACGSGHFLLAAARRLGRELARVKTGEDEPSPEALREAVREVIAHCIHGVDKNPLAVELCKVALWIESHVPGKPITFLDHRIRCGDSLLGVFDLTVLREGIPDQAFEPKSGDDKAAARSARQRNDRERAGQGDLFAEPLNNALLRGAVEALELDTIPDDTVDAIAEKARRYETIRHSLFTLRQACNLWTAGFFQQLVPGRPAITSDAVWRALSGQSVHGQIVGTAESLAEQHRFFHWPLEFPEVFEDGGFDVVLSNPPWERIKLQEEEFFASRDPQIADAPTAAQRKRLIARLKQENPALWKEYQEALHAAESSSAFLRWSGQYPLTGRGDINTYSVFAERMRRLPRPGGRAGMIVPTGIATDDTNKFFFGDLVERGELVSLFDLENRMKLFPAVDSRMKFCLVTLRRAGDHAPPAGQSSAIRHSSFAEFAFFLHRASDLADPERRFTLAAEDFRLLNPNTRTAPIFRSRRDAELTKHIYRRVPVLVDESRGEAGNPWGLRDRIRRFFDMNKPEVLALCRRVQPGLPQPAGSCAMYEAKMIHQFNHRFGDYAMQPPGSKSTQLPEVSLERLADPNYRVLPRYWAPEGEVEARLRAKGWDRGWLLGWRDITNVTNERTVIAAVIPRVGTDFTIRVAMPQAVPATFALLAMLNSFPFDYVARNKLGGTHLSDFIVEQLPVLPPDVFDRPCPWSPGETIADFIRPRVLELTFTAWDLAPFARDLGYDGRPFRYDPERRARLRAELDALFFLLYLGSAEEWEREATPELKALFPTPRHAVEYILEQFPIVRRRDEERYGEYRTKRLVLEAWERLVADASGGNGVR